MVMADPCQRYQYINYSWIGNKCSNFKRAIKIFHFSRRVLNNCLRVLKRTGKRNPMECVRFLAIAFSIFLVIITLPFSLCVIIKVVSEYERVVIFRMGRLRAGRARGPGVFFVLPCVDRCVVVDLRTAIFDVPPQETLTRDSVTMRVDAVVYYRVSEPLQAVVSVSDYSKATGLLAATILRNVLGQHDLMEILTQRDIIAKKLQTALGTATDPWGVKVERVEIMDVSLPTELQRAMATEAEAAREARAKVIAAEGEMKASRALKEASDVLCANPAAMQIRYLQTLNTISSEKSSIIVIPLSMELIKAFMKER